MKEGFAWDTRQRRWCVVKVRQSEEVSESSRVVARTNVPLSLCPCENPTPELVDFTCRYEPIRRGGGTHRSFKCRASAPSPHSVIVINKSDT